MLYLALHLPELALDVYRSHYPLPEDTPFAVTERKGATELLRQVNSAARAAGLRVGDKLSSALVRLDGLQHRPARPEQEAELMEVIAGWLLQFGPAVSLAEPATVLLEVGSMSAYFGGSAVLRHQIESGMAALGFEQLGSGIAPTPLLAQWRAQAGLSEAVLEGMPLAEGLAPLPVAVLPLSGAAREALTLLGIHTVGALLALPRAGLAKRLGYPVLHLLQQALAELPDPRPHYQPPLRFRRCIPLEWPVQESEPLLFVAQRLVRELCDLLGKRMLAIQQLTLVLQHDGRLPSEMTLNFGQPTHHAEAILLLLRERLSKSTLQAPVTALELRVEQMLPLTVEALSLFEPPSAKADRALWLARLQTRLGPAAVQGVACHADHRPELAWQAVAPGVQGSSSPPLPRPGWLLPEAQILEGSPPRLWHGPEVLTLLGSAEQIEAGGWDQPACARDYYFAETAQGRRAWLYHDRQQHAWYLHGWFA